MSILHWLGRRLEAYKIEGIRVRRGIVLLKEAGDRSICSFDSSCGRGRSYECTVGQHESQEQMLHRNRVQHRDCEMDERAPERTPSEFQLSRNLGVRNNGGCARIFIDVRLDGRSASEQYIACLKDRV